MISIESLEKVVVTPAEWLLVNRARLGSNPSDAEVICDRDVATEIGSRPLEHITRAAAFVPLNAMWETNLPTQEWVRLIWDPEIPAWAYELAAASA